MQVSAELDFVAQCCRCNFPGNTQPLELRQELDWSAVLRLARFHRVEGLVHRAQDSSGAFLPNKIAESLAAGARRIAAANLEMAAESRRLLEAFTAARATLLFVKGLTLGALAYGDAASKAAIDIDLLVRSDDLDQAAIILRKLGYRPVVPRDVRKAALRRWHRLRKESVWSRPGSPVAIDLHTRLADNPRLLATLNPASSSRSVDIGNGIALPTLGPDGLIVYLAVHGASSAWFRLKWISDFAALWDSPDKSEAARLKRRAEELGAGRAMGQALLLADSLFGTLEPLPELRRELENDSAIESLHAAALRQLARGPEPVEPTTARLGTLTIHRTQFMLQPGLGFKLSELARQLRVMRPW